MATFPKITKFARYGNTADNYIAGAVILNGDLFAHGTIKFVDDTTKKTLSINAPSGISGDYSMKFPDNNGASGDVFISDGVGNTKWGAPTITPLTILDGESSSFVFKTSVESGKKSAIMEISTLDAIPTVTFNSNIVFTDELSGIVFGGFYASP